VTPVLEARDVVKEYRGGDGATLRRYSFSLLGFLRGLGVA